MERRHRVSLLWLACATGAAQELRPLPDWRIQPEQFRKLPLTFGFWGLLQQLAPSSVTEPLDFGATDNARLGLHSSDAGTWTGTRYRLNGMDATDPYEPGRPLLLPDVHALTEVRVASGAHPDALGALNSEVGVSLREPAAGWHGALATFNTGSPLAARGLPAFAIHDGIRRAEYYRWFTRNHAAAGIPVNQRVHLLFSGTAQWSGQTMPLETADEELGQRLQFGNAAASIDLPRAQRFDVRFSGSRLDQSGYGVPVAWELLSARRHAPPLRTDARLGEENHLDHIQAGWSRAAATVRYQYSRSHLDTLPMRGRSELSTPRVDLLTGGFEGPPPFANMAIRTRHAVSASLRPASLPAAFGIEAQTATARNRIRTGERHIVTLDGAPVSHVDFSGGDSHNRVNSVLVYARHHWQWGSRLRIEGSLQSDTMLGGPMRWSHLAGSAGFAFSWAGIVFRGVYARNVAPLAGRYLDAANPHALSGVETGAATGAVLRRFGGPWSSIDPNLRRPYRDTFSVGAERALPLRAYGSLRLFRSDDRDRIAWRNTGAAFDPIPWPDCGGDGLCGTFDDQILRVWEQRADTLGQDRFVLTNPGLRTQNSGLVAETGMRFNRHGWRAVFVAEKSFGPNSPGNEVWNNDPGIVGSLGMDPNTFVNAAGRGFFDRAYVGKVQAWGELPRWLGRVEVGSSVSYVDGLAFARRVLIPSLAQGPFAVQATVRGSPEGGHRTEYNATWDLRLSRGYRLWRGELRWTADWFNLVDARFKMLESDVSGVDFEQRGALRIQPSRSLRIGIGYSF